MTTMAKTPFAISAIVVSILALQPARANTCIDVQNIVSSTPNRDGTAINFTMRDGKIWRNDLQGKCPDLRFEGFSWTIPIGTEVCEREQSIRVIQSPQICMLGKFTDVTPSKPKQP
jgi:hypothetical protein